MCVGHLFRHTFWLNIVRITATNNGRTIPLNARDIYYETYCSYFRLYRHRMYVYVCKNYSNIQEPDFAFPKKVQKQASSDLENALSAGDGARVVKRLYA